MRSALYTPPAPAIRNSGRACASATNGGGACCPLSFAAWPQIVSCARECWTTDRRAVCPDQFSIFFAVDAAGAQHASSVRPHPGACYGRLATGAGGSICLSALTGRDNAADREDVRPHAEEGAQRPVSAPARTRTLKC